ncbi:zinc finger CCCH domain-containing protein 13-like isoform X2 [Lineus longissimus]|uniref:zinc finger CCCH domain-containing protein 13-like isoform X2 n=1 Tax=Lineus longissimus TaxID=88925 RepID=UPI002B4F74C4
MRRIKLKRSSHRTSPARADEPKKREDSPQWSRDTSPKRLKSEESPRQLKRPDSPKRQKREDSPKQLKRADPPRQEVQHSFRKHSPRRLSPKHRHSQSSEDETPSKSKKSKSGSSKSKKTKHSRKSRSPKRRHSKNGEEETPHKSKKPKHSSSRRDLSKSSNVDEDSPVRSKKSKTSASPRGKSPKVSSPDGASNSKGLSKEGKDTSLSCEGELGRVAEKRLCCTRRLKGMSSAAVETMFRDFLTSKMSEMEKIAADDESVTSPQGSGYVKSEEDEDEKFVDIKEAIKDGTISDYINQKMQLIDQEFQENLARIKDDDEESGEVVSAVYSADSEEAQDQEVREAEEDNPVVEETGVDIDTEPKVDDSVNERELPKKDSSKKESKSKDKKKRKHKDKKEKSKDHKKHKDKHKDKDSKSKRSSKHDSQDRSHASRHRSRDCSKSGRPESRPGDLRDKLRGGSGPGRSFGQYRRDSRSSSWSSLDSRSRSRSQDRYTKSRDQRARSRDCKSRKGSPHDQDGSLEKLKRSSGDEKRRSDEEKEEKLKEEKKEDIPDTFIERRAMPVKKSLLEEDDDDDDFLLKKLGALKKKAATNQSDGDGVKVAPTTSIIIGGVRKAGLIRTIKNEGGDDDKMKETGAFDKPVEGNLDSVTLPKDHKIEETSSRQGGKDSSAEKKVDTVKIEKEKKVSVPSEGLSTVSQVKAEKTEKKTSNITFKGLKISLATDGAKTVSGDAEKVTEVSKEKKALPSMGIKISKVSSELISSGLTFDNKRNRIIEEGEVLDSEDDLKSEKNNGSSSSADSLDSDTTDGEIKSESETEGAVERDGKKKKKEKKKKKDKKKKRKKTKDKDKEKGRGRSISKKRSKRTRSRSRSRSPKRFRRDANGIWSTRERFRRSFSRSPDRYDERDRHEMSDYRDFRDPHMERYRHDRHDRGRRPRPFRYNDRYRRSRSRSLSRSPSLEIDKERLREIAIAKAMAAMKSGQGPVLNLNPQELACVRAGGKSVDELTDFCKRMSKKDGDDSSDGSPTQHPHNSDEEGPFMHHPFKVRDAGPIMMNIKNAKQLPILSASEKAAQSGPLRIAYPVSSGSQHRAKEVEWVPVEKTTAPTPPTTTVTTTPAVAKPAAPVTFASIIAPGSGSMSTAADAASAIAAAASTPPAEPVDKVFEEPPTEVKNLNISALVSERLTAMKKLSANPNDVEAIGTIYKANQKVQAWAQSKHLPGQFLGSTGVQMLSQQELAGPKRVQAWAKKAKISCEAIMKCRSLVCEDCVAAG